MRTAIAALTVGVLLVHAPIDAAPRSDRGEPSITPNVSSARALPPIMVSVLVAPHISPEMVSRLLAEAGEIWRPNGVVFIWQPMREAERRDEAPGDPGVYRPPTLSVSIDDERGRAPHATETPLGWIRFEGPDAPEPMIHLSYANAAALLDASTLVIGDLGRLPQLAREIYMGRAMGRALAHELGHYLLASKAHTARGLMQTPRSAAELFGRQRVHFELDAAQKQLALSRLTETLTLTRR